MRRPMIVGYARTSTIEQLAGLAGQERDLKGAGAGASLPNSQRDW